MPPPELPATRYRALVRLAASSGLRQGELLGLEEGLDFLRRKVEASQQLVTPDKGPRYFGPLKTPESYREVPLAPSAVTAVSMHMAEFPPVAVLIEDRTDPLAPQHAEAYAKWERLVKPEGSEPERVRVPEKCTLHSLRDFYASCLIRKNENVKTVQVRLGHSKPSITLDKYTGLWPTGEDRTADAIESVLGEVPQRPFSEPSALVVPSPPGTGSRTLL